MKAEMMRVRELVLKADSRMSECIKWKTPTFTFGGNMASFNPNTKAHVSLMFHTGAKIPGKHPRLIGGGDTARYMKLADMADVEASAAALEAVVTAWIELKDGGGAKKKATKKKATKKKATKKKATKKKATKKKATKKKTTKKKATKKKATKKKATKKKR